ncbi:acyltransferase family protein [Caulobacter segnis]
MFFVISGYLITRLIVQARGAGTFSWGGFYLRRARRIVPAFALRGAGRGRPGRLDRDAPPAGPDRGGDGGLGPVPRQHPLRPDPRLLRAGAAARTRCCTCWSLGVEEQFYLVWPALDRAAVAQALARRPDRPGAGPAGRIAAAGPGPGRTRFGGLGLLRPAGAGLGVPGRRRPGPGPGAPAGGSNHGDLGGRHRRIDDRRQLWRCCARPAPFPGLSAAPACLGAALLIWSGSGAAPGAALLRLGPVVGLGRISYSLYLWHWPLLVLAADVAQQPLSALQRLGLVALSLVLAILTAALRRAAVPARDDGAALAPPGPDAAAVAGPDRGGGAAVLHPWPAATPVTRRQGPGRLGGDRRQSGPQGLP